MQAVKLTMPFDQSVKVPVASGRLVTFTAEEPVQCLSDAEIAGKPRLFEILGPCDKESSAKAEKTPSERPTRAQGDSCGTCGKSSTPSQPVTISGHSETPRLLIGVGSGKAYGHWADGDRILARPEDIEHDLRFRPDSAGD